VGYVSLKKKVCTRYSVFYQMIRRT